MELSLPVNSFQAILEGHKDKGVPEIDLMATSTNVPLAGARGSSSKCPCPGLDTMENNLSLSSSLVDSPCNAEARDLPGPRNPNPPLHTSRAVFHEDSEESIPLTSPEILRDSRFWTHKLQSLARIQFLWLVLSHLHGEDISDHLINAQRASILAADVTVTRAAGHNIRKIVFSVAFARGKTLK